MRSSFKNNKAKGIGFLVIFSVALVVRIGLYLYVSARTPGSFARVNEDSTNYIAGAVNLIQHGIFCGVQGPELFRDIFRTPAYPLFIAVVYLVTNFSDTYLIAVQLVISSLTCSILYLIASKMVSKRLAFFVSLCLAFDISSVINANHILTETFFTFLVMLMVLFFLEFLQKEKPVYLAAAGIFCGITILARPVLLYFPVLIALFFLIYYWKRLKKGLMLFAIFAISCLVVVGPWFVRNASIGYMGISAVQEFNIYMYKAGWIEAREKSAGALNVKVDFNERSERVAKEVKKEGLESNQVNRSKIYKKLGMPVLLEHPFYLMEYQLIYTTNLMAADGVHLIYDRIPKDKIGRISGLFRQYAPKIYVAALLAAYAAALVGIVGWIRVRKTNSSLFFVILLCAYLTALSGEISEGSRFRVPIIPLVLILSAFGLDFIRKSMKSNNSFVQFLRYAVVGFIATIADMLVFHVLSNIMGINHIISNSISFVCGLVVNYAMSRRWVFNAVTGFSVKEFVLFALIGVIGLGISDLILYLLIDLGILASLTKMSNMEYIKLASKSIAVVIVLVWNFTARKKIVFNKVDSGGSPFWEKL